MNKPIDYAEFADLVEQLTSTEGYEPLAHVLSLAFQQSAAGKGKERHAGQKPFLEQPIIGLGTTYGPGFTMGQAAKKGQEAFGMLHRGEREKAQHEILGAIVYLAASHILIGRQSQ